MASDIAAKKLGIAPASESHRAAFRRLASCLDDGQKRVIADRYGKGATIPELAAIGVTTERPWIGEVATALSFRIEDGATQAAPS